MINVTEAATRGYDDCEEWRGETTETRELFCPFVATSDNAKAYRVGWEMSRLGYARPGRKGDIFLISGNRFQLGANDGPVTFRWHPDNSIEELL